MIVTKQLLLMSLNTIYSEINYTFEEESLLECASRCVENGKCFRLFYYKEKKKCLIYTENQPPDKIIPSTGCITYRPKNLCPFGWTKLDVAMSCYKLFNEDVTFRVAFEKCRGHEASLVDVQSQEENNFVMSFIKGSGTMSWLGGRYYKEERQWKWSDGSTITLTYWRINRPLNKASAGCIVQSDRNWVDIDCDEELHYICEREPE